MTKTTSEREHSYEAGITAYRTRVDEAIARVESERLRPGGGGQYTQGRTAGWQAALDALKAELAEDETVTDCDASEVSE